MRGFHHAYWREFSMVHTWRMGIGTDVVVRRRTDDYFNHRLAVGARLLGDRLA
jgi:hypothetical protein